MIAPPFPFAPASGGNGDRSRGQELPGTNGVWDGSHQAPGAVGRSSMPRSHVEWGQPPRPVQPVAGGAKGLGCSRDPSLVKVLTLSNFSDRPAVLEVSQPGETLFVVWAGTMGTIMRKTSATYCCTVT